MAHGRLWIEYLTQPPVGGKQLMIRQLDSDGTRYVLADYWIAYRLSFESRERVIATSTRFVRYVPHDRLVRRSAYPARVFVEGH